MDVAHQAAARRYEVRAAVATADGTRAASVIGYTDVPDVQKNGLVLSGILVKSAGEATILPRSPPVRRSRWSSRSRAGRVMSAESRCGACSAINSDTSSAAPRSRRIGQVPAVLTSTRSPSRCPRRRPLRRTYRGDRWPPFVRREVPSLSGSRKCAIATHEASAIVPRAATNAPDTDPHGGSLVRPGDVEEFQLLPARLAMGVGIWRVANSNPGQPKPRR